MATRDSQDLDALLSDVKQLLGEDPPAAPQSPAVGGETRRFSPVQPAESRPPWEDPDYAGTYYGPEAPEAPVVRSASVHAGRGTARLTARQPTQEEEREVARRQTYVPPEDEEEDEEEWDRRPRRRKRRVARLLVRLLAVVLVLAALAAGVSRLLASQPVYDDGGAMGARKPGFSTLLLIGTDAGGARTDTLMLLGLDTAEDTVSLVSIPRDTRVNGSYSVPKINGVYGINGGGEEGITMLLQRVAESIGFYPDGYVLVNLEGFVDLVDIMGGVRFNVPQDMQYSDPSQGLTIDLRAGEQTLDGEQAMGLVRYRSGYAEADLRRVEVQRDFVSAAADQWMGPGLLAKAPQLVAWLGENVETDLSLRNLFWLAWGLMGADMDAVVTETLPGYAANMGGSYYILDAAGVAEVVNRCLNPYEREITTADLSIRTG